MRPLVVAAGDTEEEDDVALLPVKRRSRASEEICTVWYSPFISVIIIPIPPPPLLPWLPLLVPDASAALLLPSP